MGSTGEPDRKRRHLSSVTPTAAPMAKKLPSTFSADDKKLDAAVLQYQNLKLLEKLKVLEVESNILERSYHHIKEKQSTYNSVLKTVQKSFENLVIDLGASSKGLIEINSDCGITQLSLPKGDEVSPNNDIFLQRLIDAGATETSSSHECPSPKDARESLADHIDNILRQIVISVNGLWRIENALLPNIVKGIPEDGICGKNKLESLHCEVKSLRILFGDFHLKHKRVALELQECRDNDSRNKANIEQSKGKLEELVSSLLDTSSELSTLRLERDETKGAFFPAIIAANKPDVSDKIKDKSKDFDDLETCLRELSEKLSSRLMEIKCLHDERIRMLELSTNLQHSLRNVKSISSSQAYINLRDRLEKLKSEVCHFQSLFKKSQIEKESLIWREKEMNMKNDITDIVRRCSTVAESRIADLGIEIQKKIEEINSIKTKLEEALKIPGRKLMVAEYKALVSTFHNEMGNMQCQLTKFKLAASDINRLRAATQSLSLVLEAKEKACNNFSARSSKQIMEIETLQSSLQETKNACSELNLILEMLIRESTDTRFYIQAKDMEYKAWASVHMLKSSLDERSIELRVKTANETEAISQQKLAVAEAEIADSRKNLEASKRDLAALSDTLESKKEANDAYLSEIEMIGQAYDDMQTKNQHLLQQVTERDDCNLNLVLEGVKAKQAHEVMLMEKKTMEKDLHLNKISLDFFNVKVARIEDQLKVCADQIRKVVNDKSQSASALENTHKKIADARKSLIQAKETMDLSQSKVQKSRASLLEIQIELETERFAKRRVEEDLEVLNRKIAHLQAQRDGSSVIDKLNQELKEYKEIVKCSVCFERPKEVVITKCYHLFCNPCVQRVIDGRQRKCPACAASFGHNDVKPVYI